MDETKLKIKRLQQHVTKSFSERMQKYGFDRHNGGTFYRKTDFGRLGVTLFYSNFGEALKIEPSASIKVDAVEKLLFEYRTKVRAVGVPPKKPNDFTVSENLGNLKIGVWKRWFVNDEPEIETALEDIENLVADVGVPFLEKFGQPDLLIQEMIDSTKRKSVLGRPIFRFEHFFALTLALKRRDVFDEMRPVYESMLENHKQYRFENVTRYLNWIAARFPE
jgi:hypothetical protein